MENKQDHGRRKFLMQSALGTAGVVVGLAGVSSFIQSCGTVAKVPTSTLLTGLDQQPLPYNYAALEDVIDAKTMEIHYSKHAAAYSKALKEAVAAEAPTETSVEKLLAKTSKYSIKMRNNAGGHYNHEMFWKSMRTTIKSNTPKGKLLEAINKDFGSFENLKTQMADAGAKRFGSGWAWLYMNADRKLLVGSTPNQDNPLMDVSDIKGFPILGLDVWEHAYYLKYQNKRAEYISNWWDVVNWDYVQQRFDSVQ